MTDEELFDRAREVNFAYKAAVADVQLELFDGEWTLLDENGWTDIKTRTYTDGIADVVVEAKKPDAHVARLTVDISPGELYDSATIYADSTCEPGDAHTISELRRPGSPDDTDQLEMQPETEHPTAEPSFGYTADGKRRFWTDEAE